MKGEVSLPATREEVYRALVDPIALSAWLDVPSVTTGEDPLHVFEIEDWHGAKPWRFRGAILERETDRLIAVEMDPVHKRPAETFRLELEDDGEGCLLRVAWSSPALEPLAAAFLDPGGGGRLKRYLLLSP
jgi:uncharacterized protein YndB with AHSA1/START domain